METTRKVEENPEGLGINNKEWQKRHDHDAAVVAAEQQERHKLIVPYHDAIETIKDYCWTIPYDSGLD